MGTRNARNAQRALEALEKAKALLLKAQELLARIDEPRAAQSAENLEFIMQDQLEDELSNVEQLKDELNTGDST